MLLKQHLLTSKPFRSGQTIHTLSSCYLSNCTALKFTFASKQVSKVTRSKIFQCNSVKVTILIHINSFYSVWTMCTLQSERRWLVKQMLYKYLKQMSFWFCYGFGTQVQNIITGNIRITSCKVFIDLFQSPMAAIGFTNKSTEYFPSLSVHSNRYRIGFYRSAH